MDVKDEIAYKKKLIEDAPLGVLFKDDSKIQSPLHVPKFMEDNPEQYFTYIMSRPEYFWLTCKELFNINIHQMQGVILQNLWNHKFPMLVGSRGLSKSFCLALYSLLRIIFLRGRKVVLCGSGFRQSQIIFNYMETIISNSPKLRSIITENDISRSTSGWTMTCKDSTVIAIPIGTGQKIRGLRANDVICDEFASVPVEIFETVIAGFAAVSADPTEQASRIAKKKMSEIVGFTFAEDVETSRGNQIIISGTAYYSFNHFAKYHEKYKKYIKSRGNKDKLEGLLGENTKDFNWKDYCIMRIPVSMVPEGFMDSSQIARAKATIHNGIYQMEYGAIFSSDSTGFFKRTLIEDCVTKDGVDIEQSNGNIIKAKDAVFNPKTKGDKNKSYVMGVDPAMTRDNFSIVIIELDDNCRRIVYCWTTNQDRHREKLRLHKTEQDNYYAYCSSKIRNLMERFNIRAIALDAQGGGLQVMEAINDSNLLSPGEVKIWPMVDYENPKETDGFDGLHIIDVVQFTREEYTTKSNHGLKKDFEDKVLLFPMFDALSFAEYEFAEYLSDNEDSLESITEEIEELKNELCTITVTTTPNTNREHFDTPEYKTPTGKKGRMQKDRYSALLMANMTARTMEREIQYKIEPTVGGFAQNSVKGKFETLNENEAYMGNQSISKKLLDLYL